MAKMGRPKKEILADKRITVRFNEEEYSLLIEEAKNREMNVTQFIRYCVSQYIMIK